MAQHPDTPASIEIRYNLGIETYLRSVADFAMVEDHRDHARKHRQQWILNRIYWTAGIGAVCYWFLLSRNGAGTISEIRLLCGSGVAMIIVGVLISGFPLMKHRKQIAKAAVLQHRAAVGPHMFSPTVLRANAEGIEIRNSVKVVHTAWAAVVRMHRSSLTVFVELVDGSGPMIPLDQVDEDSIESLTRIVDRFAAGSDAEHRVIVRVLNDQSMFCPACKYECRGIGEARCPECGREITTEDIMFTDTAAMVLVEKHLSK